MPREKNANVTLSRTLVPALPADYLSRKHLFHLLEAGPSGTTVVIAPAGYGKTSLVAEWAQSKNNSVIWMTVANGDTFNEMSAMMITATRAVVPGFGTWFERDQPLRPTEVVRRWGNDLLDTGQNFTFVLDNLRDQSAGDVDIATQLLEQFPKNVHFVAIRRDAIESIYATSSSRGSLKTVTTRNLRFTEHEVELLAREAGVEFTEENQSILNSANGWPAATSLIVAHMSLQKENVDIVSLMGSQVEPLRVLAKLVVSALSPEVREICMHLSIVEIFSLEIAELVLEDKFSFDLINQIAHVGQIFTKSRNPLQGYFFSPMMREMFLEELRKSPEEKVRLHQKLIAYYENIGLPSYAIDHAFLSGNAEKIAELFPSAARAKQAQGKGGDLLRWAPMAGDSSPEGELKRSTLRIVGHLADLNFSNVESELAKFNVLLKTSELKEFYEQFAAGAASYSLLSLGRFDELEESLTGSKSGDAQCLLGVDDQINLLRLLAAKRYLWNQGEKVEDVYLLTESLARKTNLYTSHTFLQSILALSLHQQGEYRRAYEVATAALDQYRQHGFVGHHGPLDVMYVIGRCLMEFSRPKEALEIFEQIKSLAFQWGQWHWYLVCDNHILQELTYRNLIKEALERVKISREFLATFDKTHSLATMIDINEMNIRRRMKDFDRLEKLVNRSPNIREVHQMKMFIDEHRGRKVLYEEADKLPDKTPRDIIWKHLMEASLNIETEQKALSAMRKALKAGSEVGARETFLRQRDEMGNLIIKIANESPTVYNEELATAMAARIKERGSVMTSEHPALTKRELEILRQLSTGRTLTVIAGELHISQNTMKTHLKNLYKKIGADGRHDAVEKAKATFLL